MTKLDRVALIASAPVVLSIVVVYLVVYAITFLLARRAKLSVGGAAITAMLVSFPSAPVYGNAILTPLFGATTGAGTVGLTALVCNLTIIPLSLILLARGGNAEATSKAASARSRPKSTKSTDHSNLNGIGGTLLDALASPLVWSPALGAVVTLLGLTAPKLVDQTLDLLGSATSGVAIFAVGLVLAAQKVRFSAKVIGLTLGKVIVEPALFIGVLVLLGVHTQIGDASIVATSTPSATVATLLAVRYKVLVAEAASTLFLSNVAFIVTLPLAVWVLTLL